MTDINADSDSNRANIFFDREFEEMASHIIATTTNPQDLFAVVGQMISKRDSSNAGILALSGQIVTASLAGTFLLVLPNLKEKIALFSSPSATVVTWVLAFTAGSGTAYVMKDAIRSVVGRSFRRDFGPLMRSVCERMDQIRPRMGKTSSADLMKMYHEALPNKPARIASRFNEFLNFLVGDMRMADLYRPTNG